MENKSVQEINAIRDELTGEINLRKLDNNDIVISVGLGDEASQEKSRLVVKTLCKALDEYQVKNVTIKQKAYDNQDGWAPTVMVQKPNNTNIQMYTQVTPEQANEIIEDIANANEGVIK